MWAWMKRLLEPTIIKGLQAYYIEWAQEIEVYRKNLAKKELASFDPMIEKEIIDKLDNPQKKADILDALDRLEFELNKMKATAEETIKRIEELKKKISAPSESEA
jgi:hypothetical protein